MESRKENMNKPHRMGLIDIYKIHTMKEIRGFLLQFFRKLPNQI